MRWWKSMCSTIPQPVLKATGMRVKKRKRSHLMRLESLGTFYASADWQLCLRGEGCSSALVTCREHSFDDLFRRSIVDWMVGESESDRADYNLFHGSLTLPSSNASKCHLKLADSWLVWVTEWSDKGGPQIVFQQIDRWGLQKRFRGSWALPRARGPRRSRGTISR